MKKFLRMLLLVLVALLLVGCGETPVEDDEPVEDVAAKAKEYLSSLEITYAEGDSATSVTADITFKSCTVEGVSVVWSSDKDAIAIDGLTGKVTRDAEDDVKVKITAKLTYKDITLTKPFTLTVLSTKPAVVDVTGVTVNASKTEIEVEEELELTATVAPADATIQTVTWSSSNAEVVVVDRGGKITGIAAGTATIIATSDDNAEIVGSVTITVVEPLEISTIFSVVNATEVTKTKIVGTVVAKYAQGYILYDETDYILYYLGKDATLSYNVGDTLEVVGEASQYNNRYQYTNTAIATLVSSGKEYDFSYNTYTTEQLAEYMPTVSFGGCVEFKATVTSLSASYVNMTISGSTYGLCVVYPLDSSIYEVGKEYVVKGFAMYTKEYQSVNSIYVMVTEAGELHTISFDADAEGITVDTIEYYDYTTVELPSIYREGYYFMGWFDGDNQVETLTENKTLSLKASWVEREYEEVKFETNGGSFLFNNEFYIGNYNCCSGIVKRYDCTTIYKKGSSSVAWASQYYLKFFMKEVSEGSNTYKITYKGSESVNITDLLDGNTYDYDYIISCNQTNTDGYASFKELYNDENVLNYYYYFIVPENCASVCNIKVTYDLERSKINPDALKYENDEALPDLTKENYDFVGWYDNAELTGEPYAFHVTGKTTYYAKFEATTYSITYELAEGTTTATLKETYTIEDDEFALPSEETMVREGYKFIGWFDNAAGSGTAITSIAKGTYGDKIIYAVWEDNRVSELALTADDVAVFNVVTPDYIVYANAVTAKYTVKGEGLDAKYADMVYASNKIFKSVADAVTSAEEGAIIYVCMGDYTEAVTFNNANVTLIGPNYGIHGHEERKEEAIIEGKVTINAKGITLDGVKLTGDANLYIQWGNFLVQNCIINGKSASPKSCNRSGIIAGNDINTLENITIKNNYILADGNSGLSTQPFTFNKVTNLYILNNYVANTSTATGYATTEDIMFYAPSGELKINGNEFHMYSETYLIRIGFYAYEGNIEINDNKFFSNVDGKGVGGLIQVNNLKAGYTFDFCGNEYHYENDAAFKFASIAGTINIKYNAFYGKAYKTADNTVKANYEGNFFENGVDETDATGAKESTKSDTKEALDIAYPTWKEEQRINKDYTIKYNVGSGTLEEGAKTSYKPKDAEYTLPGATINYGKFVGWYTNAEFTGEAITVIPTNSEINYEFYAKYEMENIVELNETQKNAYAYTKYVLAGAEADYNIGTSADFTNNTLVKAELGKTLFATIDEALAAAVDNDIIYVFPGTYNMTKDCTKSVTIVGAYVNYEGEDVRETAETDAKESVLTLASYNLNMPVSKFDGLKIMGSANNVNPFMVTTSTKEVYVNNCWCHYFNSFLRSQVETVVDKVYFTNNVFTRADQFIFWNKKGNVTEIQFIGNKVLTWGHVGASSGEGLFRVCGTSVAYCFNNYIKCDKTGVVSSEKEEVNTRTFFSERGAADFVNIIAMYNTFEGNLALVNDATSNNTGKATYDKNLYINAEGQIITDAAAITALSKNVADANPCADEDARKAAFAAFDYEAYIATKGQKVKVTLTASICGYSGYWTDATRAANLFLVDKATAASAGDTYAYAIRYGISYDTQNGCYVVDYIFAVGTEPLNANTSDYVIMCGDNYASKADVQSLALGDMIYTTADLSKLASGEINAKLYVVAID